MHDLTRIIDRLSSGTRSAIAIGAELGLILSWSVTAFGIYAARTSKGTIPDKLQ
jgi:hypothetical protein